MNDRKAHRNPDLITVSFHLNTNIISSFLTGLGGAVAFHPIDRALYLQVTDKLGEKKPLFHSKYWQNPMRGLSATMIQRTTSHGIYFGAQEHFQREWYPFLRKECGWGDISAKFAVGSAAGFFAGSFSNISYAIKFHTIQKNSGTFLGNGRELLEAQGYKAFTRGASSGVPRDILWGGVYTGSNAVLSKVLKPVDDSIPKENSYQKAGFVWSLRFFSAIIATIASSPLNYSRNKQFAAPFLEKAPLAMDLWCEAWLECNNFIKSLEKETELHKTIGHTRHPRLRFFAHKFGWGPGSARCAAGMALMHSSCEALNAHLKTYDETGKKELAEETQISKIKPSV